MLLKDILVLVRIKHWLKNILIFAPLVFALDFSLGLFLVSIQAFLAFSFMASSIYVINDIADIETDKIHPIKKKRPIASGTVTLFSAKIIAIVLFVLSISLSITLPTNFIVILIGYFLMNIAYSFFLKKVLIIDVMIIAIGFVLRVFAGAVVANIVVSDWIILCTFFGSLFIGFGKRKNEAIVLAERSIKYRKTLSGYTPDFLNQLLSITAGMTIISYALYTIDQKTINHFQTSRLIYTLPLVVFGIFRYFHIIYNKSSGEDPTEIFLTDKPIILTSIIWMIVFLVIVLSSK